MSISIFDAQEVLLAWIDATGIDEDATWNAVPSEDVIDSELTIPLKATPTNGDRAQWFEVTIKKVDTP